MSTKRMLVAVGVLLGLLVLAFGLSILIGSTPAPVVTPLTTTEANHSSILNATSTAGGDYHYIINEQYYTVDAVYPSQPSLSAAAATKAELIMEQGIANDIAQFKQDSGLATITAADVQTQGLGGDRKYAFGATYEKYEGSSTVSYVFMIYQDTLGAHPNSFYQTFTFDQQGKQLQLADLFKPNAAYLKKLSPLAYKGVVEQLKSKTGQAPDAGMLDTARIGTEPSPEALQFYYIDGNKLHLLFPPYQVAAYAAGDFDVAIPLASLSDILK